MRFSAVHRKSFLSLFFTVLFSALCFSPAQAQTQNPEQDPVKIFNQAQDAHEKGDLQTAVKLYGEALKIAPEFPEAEYQLAAAYVSLGKFDEAEKAFRRAIELREEWSLPYLGLGSLLIERNNFSEAEKVLLKAVELDEEKSSVYVVLTDLRLRSKASPDALKALLSEIENLAGGSQNSASLWASRGALENALGNKTAAKVSLSKALSLEPRNAFALSERAEIYFSEGDFQNAIDDARALIKISRNSPGSNLRLARFLAASGNSSEALKILDTFDQNNSEAAALKNLINSSVSEDVPTLEKQLEKDAKNVEVLSRLCSLSRASNPQKALEYCRRASEVEPANINHAIGFGAALVQARQFEAAINLLRKILQIEPENYPARANLATALFESQRFAEAKNEYYRLAEKNPDLAIAYYFLAVTHDKMGEYSQALTHYEQFLRLADTGQNRLEIERTNLRLPSLQKLIKQKGKK
jgi:tetratricopeptide (TPR) repeat protein